MIVNVSNVTVAPLEKSTFIKPMEIHYTINGVRKKWDYIQVHKSVAVIIFNVTRNVFVCVKQFRPAVYIQNIPLEDQQGVIDSKKYPIELGVILEFCAGIRDKDVSLEEIAKIEVMEETGYDISVEKLEKVRTLRSVDISDSNMHMFYVEVEDHHKKEKGGGLADEGEFIEITELTISEAKRVCDDTSSINVHDGVLLGLLWFFFYKAPTMNIN